MADKGEDEVVARKSWIKEIGFWVSAAVFIAITIVNGFGWLPVIATFAVICIFASIIIVPPFHYGVHEFLGKRTGYVSTEGPALIFPFLGSVTIVSRELKRIPFKAKFTSEDETEINAEGDIQYRADPRIKDSEQKNVHVEISEDVLTHGIDEPIEEQIDTLGGLEKLTNFITNRQAISFYLNCFFRLKEMPHLNHDKLNCGIENCEMPQEVPVDNVIDYYQAHWSKVKKVLDREEKELPDDHSPTEERYGIDIVTVTLGQIGFTEKTREALEKKLQTTRRREEFQIRMGMVRDVLAIGDVNFQEAANMVDVALEPEIARKKQIISVEGEAGILGALLSGIAGGNTARTGAIKGKKGK